jgi:asparagine synthase (glutamine-hydrolysing)
MHRYIAVVWNPLSLESVRTFQSLGLSATSKPPEWTVACDAPGTFVMCASTLQGTAQIYPLSNNGGVVLGRIFERGGSSTSARTNIDADETHRIVRSAGQHLVDSYWGNYVAIVRDESLAQVHIFRDPIGNVPCYRTTFAGVDIFFSHIDDCVRLLPISFSIDRHYLLRCLIFCLLSTADTGLEGVEHVPAGTRLTLAQGRTTHALMWDPIEIARRRGIEQVTEATSALRSTVQSTVDAWAACYENITLRLSGGFDSSVMAGCLAQAPSKPRVEYLNAWIDIELDSSRLYLPGMDASNADKFRAIAGHGDERYFARLVAERWGVPLIERRKTLAMDLSRHWHTPLRLCPGLYYTAMQTDDASVELAKTHGTQAFFSGLGGDSVFLATQQSLPAMDYAYVHGIRAGFWQQIAATARLSKESLWTILNKAIRYGVLRRRHPSLFSFLAQPSLVKGELMGTLTEADFSSDLARRLAQASLPPGKHHHVSGLDSSPDFDFIFESGRYADHVDPLNSQPVWELMLQMPTWITLTGGISRGLARRAFSDLIPEQIRKRTMKGTGSPYYQHLVRQHKDFLRTTLLDGLLVEQGYLDRRRVEECLRAEEPAMQISAVTLLNYFATEVWLQQWTEHERLRLTHRSVNLQKASS